MPENSPTTSGSLMPGSPQASQTLMRLRVGWLLSGASAGISKGQSSLFLWAAQLQAPFFLLKSSLIAGRRNGARMTTPSFLVCPTRSQVGTHLLATAEKKRAKTRQLNTVKRAWTGPQGSAMSCVMLF